MGLAPNQHRDDVGAGLFFWVFWDYLFIILTMSKRMEYASIMVTGGAGFIGSHFCRYLREKYPLITIINVDLLTYCGNRINVADLEQSPRYHFYTADIGDLKAIRTLLKKHKVDCIVNFAAESDNNKATSAPLDFANTNALGTTTLLEAARQHGVKRFHHISTCEVFGQLALIDKGSFTENSPYKPRTPYNASKAAGDMMVMSYFHTFGLPITMSYCANNYGTHQFPEKVIPVFAIKALKDQPLPVFKSSKNKREWIHVSDHCSAIDCILTKGVIGERYNIGTGEEKSVQNIADAILKILKKPKSLIETVPDRLSHDTRYLLDSTKIKKFGWEPKVVWEQGLEHTILWYRDNETWWKPLLKKSHSWKR